MNLVIDVGNTRIKIFIFDGNRIVRSFTFQELSSSRLLKIITAYRPKASLISSVVDKNGSLISLLKKKSNCIVLGHSSSLPFKNLYKTKKTLGNDRLANAAGALKLFPKNNSLVIDAGTCIKYDIVNPGKYIGGAISPGLEMRYSSLHDYTARLPLLKPGKKVPLTGRTTKESLTSGVQLGIIHEMEGYAMMYSKKYKNLKIILTGGDASRFARHLNFPIFAAPQLTAIGLNDILQHHLTKK